MKADALKKCDTTLAAFADCAKGRLLSVIWACREQAQNMNVCLRQL